MSDGLANPSVLLGLWESRPLRRVRQLKAAEGADTGGKYALRVGVVTQRKYFMLLSPWKICLVEGK